MNPVSIDPTSNSITPAPNYLPYPGRPEKQIQWGHYIFLYYKFHQLWSVGYRYDFFKDLTLKNKDNYMADNAIESSTFQVTFIPSEFSYIRASYERRYIKDFSTDSFENKIYKGLIVTNDLEKLEHRFYIQGTIIMGSHPAHTY
jgi:hypothetical protein